MHLWPHRALKPWSTGPLERRSGATQDAVAIVALITAASGKAKSIIKHGGGGKHFHFHLGIYLKIDAAAIVAPVATASGRAPKYYKTRGVREKLSFPLWN
jgi:hypothetical protein